MKVPSRIIFAACRKVAQGKSENKKFFRDFRSRSANCFSVRRSRHDRRDAGRGLREEVVMANDRGREMTWRAAEAASPGMHRLHPVLCDCGVGAARAAGLPSLPFGAGSFHLAQTATTWADVRGFRRARHRSAGPGENA